MKIINFGVVCVFFLCPATCFADFRCHTTGKIISKGMSQYEVVGACGEPASRSVIQKQDSIALQPNDKAPSAVTSVPQIEEWVYDFGPNQLIRILKFKDGRLVSTESGGYGVKK